MELKLDNGSTVGSYRIKRHLRDGSYSRIYVAQAPGGEEVVIKALKPAESVANASGRPATAGARVPYEQIVSLFENEIAVMREVWHENVVRLIQHGLSRDDNGVEFRYIACEYVRGGSLGAYCRRAGRLDVESVVRLFVPLSAGLAAVHSRGVVHCDIKPSNLLLDDAENPSLIKIADFGVAHRIVNGVAVDRIQVGTPPYAAPEHHPGASAQDLRQPLDGRADIYSLALTILFALTGKEPADRTQIRAISPPPGPPELEEALVGVLGRATARQVEQRQGTVGEFRGQLQRAYAGGAGSPASQEELETVVQFKARPDEGLPARGDADNLLVMLPDDVRLELVSIQGGVFLMGSDEAELRQVLSAFPNYMAPYVEECLTWELRPERLVVISPFRLGKYPVTNRQWRAVADLPREMLALSARKPDDAHPVTDVSWDEAQEFCARLNRLVGGVGFRLPSEAEWEYACRARSITAFHFGDEVIPGLINYNGIIPSGPQALERGWKVNPKTDVAGSVDNVNDFGLYDLHGNVWEWCADAWHDSYVHAPATGAIWEEVKEPLRVIRGGSCRSFAAFCRSASRARFLRNDRADDIGFRLAASSNSAWHPRVAPHSNWL